jgi:predicted porin
MKKNVIALAVAAAMAAPLAAQAEVTVSGGLQAEVVSVGGDATGGALKGLYANDGMEFGSPNGGSFGYLAFSAAEDLGNGLKAIAKYNMNINVAGGLGSRDTYVGLSGGFGTVLAGKLSTPYKSSTVSWDPFLATSLQARGSGGMSDAHNGYATSALAYANKFGPATVVLAMVVDDSAEVVTAPAVAEKTAGKHAKSLSVNVPVGPVEVAVAHVNANEFTNMRNLGLSGTADLLGVNTLETLTATKVGVKYAAGPITVAGQYEALELGNATTIKPTVVYVTGSYAMGANTFSASYGDTKWDISGVDNTKYMAIGLTHAFSKSTSSTIGYRSTDAGNFGDKETAFAAGLRVSF